MDESRRLAMRRAHAGRTWHCTCGKTVHGNGGRANHVAMHKRRGDGHYFMTRTAYEKQQEALHPYCQDCGWRKGGTDSWDGKKCKCGHWEPAMSQHGMPAIKAAVAEATRKRR